MSKIHFNDNWTVQKEGEHKLYNVTLPHDAMIYEKRDPDCVNGCDTGFYPGGCYIYTKDWFVPAEYKNKNIVLEFEGVYKNASVYINGQLAAKRPYGYSGFYADCDGLLKYDCKNEIKVIADNSKVPNSRWYSGSGIYRPVYLHIKEKTHIALDGIKINTTSIDPAIIHVCTTHNNGEVTVEILDNGNRIASAQGDNVDITIENAKLWSDEIPQLYQCKVTLYENADITDEETVSFGIRTLSWSTNGFFVNGHEVKLRGACIHHDNGIVGACAFRDAEERKIRLLKEAGFNAVRSAHNPCSKYLLEAADKYGVYVMDELTDMWYRRKKAYDYALDFEDWFEQDIKSMVEKCYNHPSVMMYSTGNEIVETSEKKAIEVSKQMQQVFHSLDPSRPVTCGINLALSAMGSFGIGVFQDEKPKKKKPNKNNNKKKPSGKKLVSSELYNTLVQFMGNQMNMVSRMKISDKATAGVFEYVDICGYNYAVSRYANEPKHHPERIIVGSETRPPTIVENWKLVSKLPYVIGDFMWAGYDYLGEAGIGAVSYSSQNAGVLLKKYPYLLANSGIIDLCGQFRPEVWLTRAAYGIIGNKPYIGVEPLTHAKEKSVRSMWRQSDAVHSWSWQGCKGFPADIVVYSNADSVKLLLNDAVVAHKKVKDCKAEFKTVYDPGTLTAINYNSNGDEIGRDILKTAANKTVIQLDAEKGTLTANGQDLCYLHIYLTDENGEVKAAEDTSVTVKVTGEGVLQGLGSANPYTEEGFASATHRTYYGRALAVIRSGHRSGEIKITVTAAGLEPCHKTIIVSEK